MAEQELQKFEGEVLTPEELERTKGAFMDKVRLRKARYFCFRFQTALTGGQPIDNAPAGFKEYIESQSGFFGWENFAKSWDIEGSNPFRIVPRLESVWDKWDSVMIRVAIPLNASEEEIKARVELLSQEYKRKEMEG